MADTVLEDFSRNGYVLLPNVLDQQLMAEVKNHVLWLQQQHPETSPERLGTHLVAQDPFWVRLCSDPRLLAITERFIGPDIALFASGYNCKPPYTGSAVPWHQDGNYWPLEPKRVVTLWLAVDDATPENGCMQVLPGTHQQGMLPHVELREANTGSSITSGIEPDQLDLSRAVDVALSSGGIEVHDPYVVHGSPPNTSAQRRCGLTIGYIPASTRVLSQGWTKLFLQGTPQPGINEYQAHPIYDPKRHMAFQGCEEWQ